MDLRVYDLFQDPVFVFQSNRTVIYANPAARRWISWPDELEMHGRPIEELVVFQGTNIISAAARLKDFQVRPYLRCQVIIPNKKHETVAKTSVQRLPLANSDYLAVLAIRERGFMEVLMDEEDPIVVDEDTATLNTDLVMADLKAGDTQVLNRMPEMTITSAVSNDRTARLEARCNIQILAPKMSLSGETLFISDNWIEVAVFNATVPIGAKASLEVMPTDRLRGFTTKAVLVKSDQSPSGQILLRLQYESLSALMRRSLEEYLEKSAIKI